jgi:multidrug/hemolysin transport system ATP-binding protein
MHFTYPKLHLTSNFLYCHNVSAKMKKTKGADIMAILMVDKLTKCYGDIAAVDNISFEVNKGELLGFLGVNGAGKSTTINMLSTLMKPSSGSAKVCGCTLGKEDMKIRGKIGIVYQQNCLDSQLSVRENLMCRGILHGTSNSAAKKRLWELCEILSLGDILKKQYATLSGGQKRRCEIAAALMHTPELLFLDEPTTGLDPATRMEVWAAVEELRQNTGMTVFLTTHYMEEAAKANRIIILEKGHIMASGTPFELKERYASDLVKIYCTENDSSFIHNKLSEQGMNPQPTDYGFCFMVKNTVDAIEPVHSIREHISGFEVIQGNMDDVFLNVCGRTLKEEEL